MHSYAEYPNHTKMKKTKVSYKYFFVLSRQIMENPSISCQYHEQQGTSAKYLHHILCHPPKTEEIVCSESLRKLCGTDQPTNHRVTSHFGMIHVPVSTEFGKINFSFGQTVNFLTINKHSNACFARSQYVNYNKIKSSF